MERRLNVWNMTVFNLMPLKRLFIDKSIEIVEKIIENHVDSKITA